MIAGYKALYQFNVDRNSSQHKGPFNTILSSANVFSSKDTAIVTPNSDTPYSMLQVDLRAEPMVFCVPAIDKAGYYSVQLTDMYSFNYGHRQRCRALHDYRAGQEGRPARWSG